MKNCNLNKRTKIRHFYYKPSNIVQKKDFFLKLMAGSKKVHKFACFFKKIRVAYNKRKTSELIDNKFEQQCIENKVLEQSP